MTFERIVIILLNLLPFLAVAGFIIYCIVDMVRFSRGLKARGEKFSAELKQQIDTALQNSRERIAQAQEENKRKIDQAIVDANKRIDLLSKENAKLMEQNEAMRDKLKNLGFTEPYF